MKNLTSMEVSFDFPPLGWCGLGTIMINVVIPPINERMGQLFRPCIGLAIYFGAPVWGVCPTPRGSTPFFRLFFPRNRVGKTGILDTSVARGASIT